MDITDYLQKAKLAFEKGNEEYAIELLTHILSQSPNLIEARSLLHLVRQRLAQKKGRSPIHQILTSIIIFPDLLKAKWHESKKDRWKAISAYENILSKNPIERSSLLRMAHLLVQEQQLPSAIQILEELLQTWTNHLPALKQVAQLYMKVDQENKARECYERILKIDPKNTEAERSLKNLDALGTIRGMKETQ